MIARLKGILDDVGEDWAIVDVGGVGYFLYCSARTLAVLPGNGGAVRLEVETHVREDHIHLFGFATVGERDWFRLLITVQGVGARAGLAILSVLSPEELAQAVAAEDKAMIARANGVGPKLAARIAGELKEKAASFAFAPVTSAHSISDSSTGNAATTGGVDESGAQTPPVDAAAGNAAMADAVSALVNLGYGRSEAFAALARVSRRVAEERTAEGEGAEPPPDAAAFIRAGLQELSR